ncbi:HigA family addiction module antitoxin [Anaerolineales bacterium HSG24]|nr:HigA family addiction module antitoxin [Anaerolineales bacterium HSG24]
MTYIVLEVSPRKLATAINISIQQIDDLVTGHQSVTADIALRLARYLGTSAELWMNLQALYDLERTRGELAEQIEREIKPFRHAVPVMV